MRRRRRHNNNFKKSTVIITFIALIVVTVIGIFKLTNTTKLSPAANNNEKKNSEVIVNNSSSATLNDIDSKNEELYSAPQDVIDYLKSLQAQLPPTSAIDKDSMLKKMYNTGAYIYSASGEFEEWRRKFDENSLKDSTTNVKFDLKISKDKIGLLNESVKGYNGRMDQIMLGSLDGTNYVINELDKTYTQYKIENNKIQIPLPKNPIMEPSDGHVIAPDGNDMWNGIFEPLVQSGHARWVLGYREVYNGFFLKGSTWDVTSTEDYLGFKCAIIEGILEVGTYSSKLETKNFKFWIDTETGILLKYEWYDADGNLSASLTTKRLEINNELTDSIFQKDLTGYKDMTNDFSDIPQMPQELVDLDNKITEYVSNRVNSEEYVNLLEFVDCEVINSEKMKQVLIKLKKKDVIPEESLVNIREEMKDQILAYLNEANLSFNEIIFLQYEGDSGKDIDQYTISIDGVAEGWNTN